VIKSDGSFIPILPKYNKPTDTVTAAVRDVLTKSGYVVTPDRPSWDLSEATIRTEWGTLLISGTIDALEVVCTKKAFVNEYKATARVTLIFADVQNRKIFYRLASESTSSLDHPFFSEERLEGLINGVLADAVEKAIERPETDRQIRQAFKP
jgi:hypothetical protein